MNETRETPGPWKVIEGVPDGGGIGIGPEILNVGGPHALVTFNGGESEANARLIAAAPALYEALGALVAYHEVSLEGTGNALPIQVQNARAALRQARGDA